MKKCDVIVKEDEQPQPHQVTIVSRKYKECRRNYAVGSGGYVVDGCKEFKPSGDEGNNVALFCRKCGCHRNFHQPEEIIEAICDSPTPPPLNQTA